MAAACSPHSCMTRRSSPTRAPSMPRSQWPPWPSRTTASPPTRSSPAANSGDRVPGWPRRRARAAKIERDLHDGAQQRLVALRIELELAEDLVSGSRRGRARACGSSRWRSDEALEELRALAHGVYPPLLADRGLSEALQRGRRRSPIRSTRHARRRALSPRRSRARSTSACSRRSRTSSSTQRRARGSVRLDGGTKASSASACATTAPARQMARSRRGRHYQHARPAPGGRGRGPSSPRRPASGPTVSGARAGAQRSDLDWAASPSRTVGVPDLRAASALTAPAYGGAPRAGTELTEGGSSGTGSSEISTTTASGSVAARRRAVSRPSMPGIRTSTSTRSGLELGGQLQGLRPEAASPTCSNPGSPRSGSRAAAGRRPDRRPRARSPSPVRDRPRCHATLCSVAAGRQGTRHPKGAVRARGSTRLTGATRAGSVPYDIRSAVTRTPTASRPIRVVLADDSYLVREAVDHVLAGADGIELVATCERPRLAVRGRRGRAPGRGRDRHPDAALGRRRGPAGRRRAPRRTHPEIGVVVLSQYAEPATASRCSTAARTGARTCSRSASSTAASSSPRSRPSPRAAR